MASSIIANYPNGFSGGVAIRGMPVLNAYSGTVFWVDSVTGSNGNKGTTKDRPFATLDYAIGRCTANKGDIIMVMPKHAESLSGAAAIVFDVAGVTVIGLGHGNQRPTFTCGTSTDIDVTADDVTIQNLVFKPDVQTLATVFDVDAKNFRVIGCEFNDGQVTAKSAATYITSGSTTDNVCDGLTLIGNKFYAATDSHVAAVTLVGDTDYLWIEDNHYQVGNRGTGAGSAGIFLNGTSGDDWNQFHIANNKVYVTNTATDSWPLGGGGAETDNSGLFLNNVVSTRASVGTSAAVGANMFTKMTGQIGFVGNYYASKITDAGQIMPFPTSGGAVY